MSDLLNSVEAAKFLHLRPQTLACWRLYGKGPAFIRIGRIIRYDRRILEEWVSRNTVPTETRGEDR